MTEELEIVFIPSLISLIVNAQQKKAQPLTQNEVEAIRDNATCIATPIGTSEQLAKSRGYDDINPAQVWLEYLNYLESD